MLYQVNTGKIMALIINNMKKLLSDVEIVNKVLGPEDLDPSGERFHLGCLRQYGHFTYLKQHLVHKHEYSKLLYLKYLRWIRAKKYKAMKKLIIISLALFLASCKNNQQYQYVVDVQFSDYTRQLAYYGTALNKPALNANHCIMIRNSNRLLTCGAQSFTYKIIAQ